jgi:predicted P-loop ATPase
MKVKSKKIALYPSHSVTDIKGSAQTDIDAFLADVTSGRWQDAVLKVRACKDPAGKKKLKEALPCVTISGIFIKRTNDTLDTHSGFIAIDIDHLEDAPFIRDFISADPFVYAAFLSCSSKGVCALVKVDPKTHKEAYGYMSEHFYKNYAINTDPVCTNLARIRYVSYDPDLRLNPAAVICPAQPTPKAERKQKQYLFRSEDFDRIIKEVEEKEIDLTSTYNDWMLCALALINKFEPETAREYFHLLSAQNPDYEPDKTDAKFDHLLKTNREIVSIDWFYWHVEKNGIKPYGKETEQELMFQVVQDDDTRSPEISKEFAKAQLDEMSTVAKVKLFLSAQHKEYVRNMITEELTGDGQEITDLELNSFYVKIRDIVDDKVQFDLVRRILFSDFVKQFHPFKDFIQIYLDNPPVNPTGHIDNIIKAIVTDTPNAGIFIKKWLVSMVASAFGVDSELVLVFCGDQNTGKTKWFKLILPEPLKDYRASLNWSGDKDEIIRMSRNLIMLDDEMGGKSMREEKQIKKVTSIDKEQTRGSYKSMDAKYKRIAIFCGTTNEDWFLSDSTGNRRFLPIHVLSMNFDLFNSVDKGLLFFELYQEWKNGYDTNISEEEQKILDDISAEFTKPNTEEELISKYLSLPTLTSETERITPTDLYGYLKRMHPWSPIRMNELGRAMKKAGFVKTQRRTPGTKTRTWFYDVVKVNTEFKIEYDEI